MKSEKKRTKWGTIKWYCKKCGISVIQDELKKCPFCGNEDLRKDVIDE